MILTTRASFAGVGTRMLSVPGDGTPVDLLHGYADSGHRVLDAVGVADLPVAGRWRRNAMAAACRANLRTVRDPDLRRRLNPDYQPMCRRLPEHIAMAVSHVPRRMKFALGVGQALPQRARRLLSRITRTEQVYLAVDQATRDAYHARAGH